MATPVHSLVLVRPWVCCTVCPVGAFHSIAELPEHSINASREVAGNRFKSSMVKAHGCATKP